MKKPGIVIAGLLLIVVIIGVWLVASTNPASVEREPVSVPVDLPNVQ